MRKTALILEDDKALNEGINDIITGMEMNSYRAYDIKEAKKILKIHHIDIVILDINLPDGNGLDFLTFCKKNYSCMIIIVSALDMDIDVVRGLELGADDYVTKPFSMLVLRARIQNALRKKSSDKDIIYIDDMSFDFKNMIFEIRGVKTQFSITEQKALRLLLNNRGNVVPLDKFMSNIWDCTENFVDKHALTVTIKRLREKIEVNPSNSQYIKNIYGIGYIWNDEKK